MYDFTPRGKAHGMQELRAFIMRHPGIAVDTWCQVNGNAEPRNYGRCAPHMRVNVDQVPLPFVSASFKSTYAVKGSDRVSVIQPGDGALSKRMCTLPLAIRPASAEGAANIGVQPRPAIIFRGKGKRLKQSEKDAWHPDVDVYFQPKAWAGTNFCLAWVKRT